MNTWQGLLTYSKGYSLLLIVIVCFISNLDNLNGQSIFSLTLPTPLASNASLVERPRVNYSIPVLSTRISNRRYLISSANLSLNNLGIRLKDDLNRRIKHRVWSSRINISAIIPFEEKFYYSRRSKRIRPELSGIVLGYEFHYNIHYKQSLKQKGEDRIRDREWFSDDINSTFHTIYGGVKIHGLTLALSYSPKVFLNEGFVDIAGIEYAQNPIWTIGFSINTDYLISWL